MKISKKLANTMTDAEIEKEMDNIWKFVEFSGGAFETEEMKDRALLLKAEWDRRQP